MTSRREFSQDTQRSLFQTLERLPRTHIPGLDKSPARGTGELETFVPDTQKSRLTPGTANTERSRPESRPRDVPGTSGLGSGSRLRPSPGHRRPGSGPSSATSSQLFARHGLRWFSGGNELNTQSGTVYWSRHFAETREGKDDRT